MLKNSLARSFHLARSMRAIVQALRIIIYFRIQASWFLFEGRLFARRGCFELRQLPNPDPSVEPFASFPMRLKTKRSFPSIWLMCLRGCARDGDGRKIVIIILHVISRLSPATEIVQMKTAR